MSPSKRAGRVRDNQILHDSLHLHDEHLHAVMFPLLAATVIGIHYIHAFVHMVATFKSCCQFLEVLNSQRKVLSF